MPPLNLLLAFLLDLLLGDPSGLPHPVIIIGNFAARLERALNRPGSGKIYLLTAGLAAAAIVVASTFAVTFFIVGAAYRHLGKLGGGAVEIILAYTTLSAKSLAGAAKEVLRPLVAGDLPEARRKLSMVVGRDTENLDAPQVVRGAVETVAENTSDGVIAPLFYLALGGAPLAMAYKAVNTLDSMFGYKNERFLYFGRAAARLDDIANFIPARLSALFTVIASFLLNLTGGGYSWRSSLRALIKDRLNHTSPNSGYPEAAAAGALGVRLGGENSYFGVASVKPFIGEPSRPLAPERITESVRLMYLTAALGVIIFAAVRFAVSPMIK
ncbi:MAG: adenosylcobinamide-phosphate synthase CbiB [Nitrospirota bacterium]